MLRLPGYTEHEKVEIAKRFLIPKQMEANGLTDKNMSFTDDAVQTIINHYTREAGVRNLEREICRFAGRLPARSSSIGRDQRTRSTPRM